MPKDRAAFLIFTLYVVMVVVLGSLTLGIVVYATHMARQPAGLFASVTATPEFSLAAVHASAPSPTSAVPTLPPEWTATPFPTRAAPTASQPPSPTHPSVPDATLTAVEAGPLTTAPPAAAGPSDAPPPTAPPTTITPLPPDTPQPSMTPVPGAGSIGQRVEAGGMGLTVMGISKQGDSPVHFVVDVVLENISQEQALYAYSYFGIVNSAGKSYEPAINAPEPSLQYGVLDLGGQVRGNVAFQIEPEAHELTLIYYLWSFSGEDNPIQVNLGQ